VPESVELILLKALAKSPADRYQTAEDFVYAVHMAIPDTLLDATAPPQINTIPVEAAPPENAKPSQKWILPAGILVAAGLLALGILWMGRQLTSQSPPLQPGPAAIGSTALPPVATMTHTAVPTPIPPSATVPVSHLSLEYLNDVQVLNADTFDDPLESGWNIQSGAIENGIMELIGNENWLGAFPNAEFGEREGILIDFNYSADSLSEIYLEHGTWDTDQYRRFGLYIGGNQAETNEYEGRTDYGGTSLSGSLMLEPGRSYSLLIAILPDGEFLEAVWDPSNSATTLLHRETFDETWAGLTWRLYIGVNKGTVQVDNFNKIKFSNAR
jgi:hypothetical protein